MGFIKGTLSYLSGVSLFKKQASYIKSDFSGLKVEAKTLGAKLTSKEKIVDDWNTVIINHGINSNMVINQYFKRRIISVILLFTFFISTYFVIVDSRFVMGLPAVILSFLFYTNNALRLYQIRQRELCAWGKYLSVIRVSFKEILPLALPNDWQLMQSKKNVDVATMENVL